VVDGRTDEQNDDSNSACLARAKNNEMNKSKQNTNEHKKSEKKPPETGVVFIVSRL